MLRYGTFQLGTNVVTDDNLSGEILEIFPGGLACVSLENDEKKYSKWYYVDELKLK